MTMYYVIMVDYPGIYSTIMASPWVVHRKG